MRFRSSARATSAVIALFALLTLALPSRADAPGASRAIQELRLEDAAEELADLSAFDSAAEAHYLRARLEHNLGNYEDALQHLDLSLADAPAQDGDPRIAYRALLESTVDATAAFVETASDDGRYRILSEAGQDQLLAPYAIDTLRRVDEALHEELGYRVPGPIRLEIFPSTAGLAAVSSLTEENIRTSGTIALSKWDRLMVTSPRALVRGYGWLDTIAHEFVHLVLARMTRDNAPVWVQEGFAKFLEHRWRTNTLEEHMIPSAEGMLANAYREDTLIPFEQLHPSIALLPSQEQAALAYAQVSSFVARFHEDHGSAGLRQVAHLLAEGQDAQDAFAEVAGVTFSRLEAQWRGSLSELEAHDAPPYIGLAFVQTPPSLNEEGARRLRLGDMLWARERYGAAGRQYALALEEAPDSPLLAARLARASLAFVQDGGTAIEGAELAVTTLEPVVEAHPTFGPAHAYLASAYRVLGRNDEAKAEAYAAIAINPFDPRPHCVLSEVLRENDSGSASHPQQTSTAEEEERACTSLGGRTP